MKKYPVKLFVALCLSLAARPPPPARSGRAHSERKEDTAPRGLQPLFGTDSQPERMHARNLTWRYLEDHRGEFRLDRKNHMGGEPQHARRLKIQRMCPQCVPPQGAGLLEN